MKIIFKTYKIKMNLNMKTAFEFSVESLLFGIENPKGNIEQVLFAKKMTEYEGMPNCNRLAKLSFADDFVNMAVAGAVPLDETLVLGYEGWSDSVFHLCIRSGKTAIRMAMGSFPSREIIMSDDYSNAVLLNKLSEEQVKEVFDFIWNNMDVIQPKPGYMFKED
ncbi:hypothetical protein P2W68_01335 [Chryseobacterium arthrosphaerae]|uniref:hypothetical protein n=1 Tax=Chryseobacterium arthrosphaerae TaxID=651561 RepID=UPI0023E2F3F1|nr:hypothetical protein [Chryseobacterium arthrosphaerae]WES98268.1 hypothetical protein P2W68_01335 [Chryseobacterium arthrosphaerae]